MSGFDVSVETSWGVYYIKIDKELRISNQLVGHNISHCVWPLRNKPLRIYSSVVDIHIELVKSCNFMFIAQIHAIKEKHGLSEIS
jgi:hypothetical protein